MLEIEAESMGEIKMTETFAVGVGEEVVFE